MMKYSFYLHFATTHLHTVHFIRFTDTKHQNRELRNYDNVKVNINGDLLYWIELDCSGVPIKMAIECISQIHKLYCNTHNNLSWLKNCATVPPSGQMVQTSKALHTNNTL